MKEKGHSFHEFLLKKIQREPTAPVSEGMVMVSLSQFSHTFIHILRRVIHVDKFTRAEGPSKIASFLSLSLSLSF